METLIIQYDILIKEKLMKLLSTFSEKELEIIGKDEKSEQIRKELHEDYDYMVREDAEFYNHDDAIEQLKKLREEKTNKITCTDCNYLHQLHQSAPTSPNFP